MEGKIPAGTFLQKGAAIRRRMCHILPLMKIGRICAIGWSLAPFACMVPAHAAVTAITAADFTTAAADPYNLATVTTAGHTFSAFTFTTYSSATTSNTYALQEGTGGINATVPANNGAALSDQSPFTGALNTTGDFFFTDAPLSLDRFFLFVRSNNGTTGEATNVIALDGSGSPLDLTVTLAATDWGLAHDVVGSTWKRPPGADFGNDLGGLSFAASDFVGTAALADVRGLRFSNTGIDPALIAFGSIPEPAVASLMGLGLIAVGTRRRRGFRNP